MFILEVMGRHAGWLAAAGALAQQQPTDPPHIILLPEVPFQQQAFLDKVKHTVKQQGSVSQCDQTERITANWGEYQPSWAGFGIIVAYY